MIPPVCPLTRLLILAVGFIVGESAYVRAQEPLPIPSNEEVEGALRLFDVPGISIGFTIDGRISKLLHVGHARLRPASSVTASTLFEAASVSKPVFAWIVMRLVEDGLIDLDRPVARDLDYPRIKDKDAYAKITPRMILTHRTGLPNWVGTEVNIHDRTTTIPFESAPGTAYTYSGEAIQLLQALVEQETGRTLQSLVVEHLGDVMPSSTFTRPLRGDVTESRGYQAASDPNSERKMDDVGATPERAAAAYSLVTTAKDLGQFLNHVYARRGLKPQTYDEMFRAQSPLPQSEGPPGASYGLGWLVIHSPAGKIVGHTGNNGKYRSIAFVSLENGEGLAALANSATSKGLLEFLAEPPPAAASPSTDPIEVFDAFCDTFQRNYALFGVKRIDWRAACEVHRKGLTHQSSEQELWNSLGALINLLNDVHVTLSDPDTGKMVRSGGRSIGTGPFDNGMFSIESIAANCVSGLSSDPTGRIHWGRLPNDVGYLRIDRFQNVDQSAAAVDSALGIVGDAKAIVVDVRHNGGGDDHVGQAIAGRFVQKETPYLSVALRNLGRLPATFRNPVRWKLTPSGPKQFTKPIALLINDRSISAAENFAIAMQAIDHAVLIGETTAGVMADAVPHRLPNGWQVSVPANVFRDINGICWEGIGIAPDYYVTNRREEVANGVDGQLNFAVELLEHLDAKNLAARTRVQSASTER